MMAKYIVLFDYSDFNIFQAEDFKGVIVKLYRYTNGDSSLLEKALVGCETIEDVVTMFREFGGGTINAIYAVDKPLYKAKERE